MAVDHAFEVFSPEEEKKLQTEEAIQLECEKVFNQRIPDDRP